MLVGVPTGHPTLMAELIHTSRLCGIDAEMAWARTASRWYRLNDPATSENVVQQLGKKGAMFKHLIIELSQVQVFIEEDRDSAGLAGD
jgi:hypothetical protein